MSITKADDILVWWELQPAKPNKSKAYPSHEYVVKEGDTLGSIATAHGMTWQALWDINRDRIADPNIIHVGQKIRIKGAEIVVPPKPELTKEQKIDKITRFMIKQSEIGKYDRRGFIDRETLAQQIHKCHLILRNNGLSRLDESRETYALLITLSRYYEMCLLAEAIVDQAHNDDEICKLVGLAWQESHFLNVIGKHGEVTFYQFLPSTVKWWYRTDDIGLVVEIDRLKNSPSDATHLALDMLRKHKWDWLWWNHNPLYKYHVESKISRVREALR